MKPISEEAVDAWFERVVAAAKENLLRDGTLAPVAMLLTDTPEPDEAEALPEWTFGLEVGFGRAFHIPWNDPDGVLYMFVESGGEKARAFVVHAVNVARDMGLSPDAAVRSIVSALEKAVGSPKDIAAAYMRKRVEEAGGVYAVLQVHEVWTASIAAHDERPAVPVSKMPDREEAILVMLETKTGGRTAVIPFRREGGSEEPTAKVVGFGEPKDSRGKAEGRFAGLLGEVH